MRSQIPGISSAHGSRPLKQVFCNESSGGRPSTARNIGLDPVHGLGGEQPLALVWAIGFAGNDNSTQLAVVKNVARAFRFIRNLFGIHPANPIDGVLELERQNGAAMFAGAVDANCRGPGNERRARHSCNCRRSGKPSWYRGRFPGGPNARGRRAAGRPACRRSAAVARGSAGSRTNCRCGCRTNSMCKPRVLPSTVAGEFQESETEVRSMSSLRSTVSSLTARLTATADRSAAGTAPKSRNSAGRPAARCSSRPRPITRKKPLSKARGELR